MNTGYQFGALTWCCQIIEFAIVLRPGRKLVSQNRILVYLSGAKSNFAVWSCVQNVFPIQRSVPICAILLTHESSNMIAVLSTISSSKTSQRACSGLGVMARLAVHSLTQCIEQGPALCAKCLDVVSASWSSLSFCLGQLSLPLLNIQSHLIGSMLQLAIALSGLQPPPSSQPIIADSAVSLVFHGTQQSAPQWLVNRLSSSTSNTINGTYIDLSTALCVCG